MSQITGLAASHVCHDKSQDRLESVVDSIDKTSFSTKVSSNFRKNLTLNDSENSMTKSRGFWISLTSRPPTLRAKIQMEDLMTNRNYHKTY